jgi:opacity protein-like surface antigen
MCDTPLREMPRESHAISTIVIIRRILCGGRVTLGWIILCLIFPGWLHAQEPIRSAAPPAPIEAYRRSPDAFFYLGPFQEVITGYVSTQYTDNVNLTPTDKISNLSFTLGMGMNTTWVVSHLNQLNFRFGGEMTENLYGNGRRQLTFAIAPNSTIEFKFAISDVQIRLFDNFSYTQNPTTNPNAANTANLNNLTNTIGAVAETDLNIALLSLGADYTYNNQSGQNSQGQNNQGTTGTRETFRVSPSLTFRLTPAILYGINASATRSTGQNTANVNSLSFGPFMNGKLGKFLEFDLALGGTLVSTTPAIAPTYYFSGAVRYQLNRHWQILLSGSHELVFSTGTALTEQNLVRLGTQLQVTRAIFFNISPFANFGNVETTTVNSGTPTGPYTQLGLEAGLSWKPRKRWSTGLTYQYIRRESGSSGPGAASDNYIQNTLSLSVNYAF